MKKWFYISIGLVLLPLLHSVSAQDVQVHPGGELVLFGNTDASASPGVKWISSRGPMPGYFTILDDWNGRFTNYSDNSHINGYVKKHGSSAFTFPVGNGMDLRTLDISKPELTSDTYAVAWIDGDPGTNLDPTFPNAGPHPVNKVLAPIESVSKLGQWDWLVGEGGNLGDQTTGTGKGIRITASIPDLSQFADKNELRLVGWNGIQWIDLSGRPSANGNAKNSRITGTMVPGITAIGIGRVKSAIPVRFEFVEASVVNCKTKLQWKTSIETGSSFMVVEQSINEGEFKPIMKTATNGNPTGGIYTAWLDQPQGRAFYRVRMENTEGVHYLSPTASCQLTCKDYDAIALFPNPLTTQVNIQVRIKTQYTGTAFLKVYSTNGRQVNSYKVACKNGINLFSVQVTDLSVGYYIVEIRNTAGDILGTPTQFIKQ